MLSHVQCPGWNGKVQKRRMFLCPQRTGEKGSDPVFESREYIFINVWRSNCKLPSSQNKWRRDPSLFSSSGSVCSFGPVIFFLLFPTLTSSSSFSSSSRSSAALARFDDHVGKLLNTGCAANEIHNSEGLQVLRYAAGRGRGLGVQLVVQGQDLSRGRDTVCEINNCFSKGGAFPFTSETFCSCFRSLHFLPKCEPTGEIWDITPLQTLSNIWSKIWRRLCLQRLPEYFPRFSSTFLGLLCPLILFLILLLGLDIQFFIFCLRNITNNV